MESGVNFHFAREWETDDREGYDRQFTEADAVDLGADTLKAINGFGFFMKWANRGDYEDKDPTEIVKSSQLTEVVPYSKAAYKKLVTDPDAEAAAKAAEERRKQEEEAASKDGAEQISASAVAILAAAYTLAF